MFCCYEQRTIITATNSGYVCARMLQEPSERGVGYHGPYPESALPRMLVRGAAESPDIDEFALLLQPIKDTRRNYRGITGKLIQL